MRAAAGLLLVLGVSGCFGSDLGACEQRTGSGLPVEVRVVWNATAPTGPAAAACVQGYPTDAGDRVDALRVEGRADALGQATLGLAAGHTWRLFARIATPEDKACGYTSQTVELEPDGPATVELRLDRGQKVCA